jgi:hypothetical protein
MLTAEENELLTRIGQGTRMGEVLRRYWHPVGCSECVTTKPQRVKVLGEELVLYREQSGRCCCSCTAPIAASRSIMGASRAIEFAAPRAGEAIQSLD